MHKSRIGFVEVTAVFGSDLVRVGIDAIGTRVLQHEFEERQKELLNLTEELGLRGPAVDVLMERAMENAQEAARGMVVGDVLTRAIGMDTDRQRKGDEMRLSAVLQAMGWDKRRAQRNGKRARLWFPSAV